MSLPNLNPFSTESSCSSCPTGQYGSALKNDDDGTSCTDCPDGTFMYNSNLAIGATSALECSYSAATCPPGTEPNTETHACDPCVVGKYQIGMACKICGAGKFIDQVGQSGQDSCLSCSPGTFNADKGVIAEYHDSSEDCLSCPDQTHSNFGAAFCDQCPAGKSTLRNTTSKTTSCLPCDTGRYQDSSGNESCLDCPIGWYQMFEQKQFCLPCIRKFFFN